MGTPVLLLFTDYYHKGPKHYLAWAFMIFQHRYFYRINTILPV